MSYKHPRKSKYKLVVKRSSAGLGIFTEDFIKKDAFVIEYYGPILNEKGMDEKGGKYLFEIDKKWTVDGSLRKNTARYMNHSCNPNCEPEIEGKRVFMYAIKNIKPGKELTFDYGKEYFDDFIKRKRCKCESCKNRREKKRAKQNKNASVKKH